MFYIQLQIQGVYVKESLDRIPLTYCSDFTVFLDSGQNPESLSFATGPYPIPNGQRMALDLFCDGDLKKAKKHVDKVLH